jgi:hypothetical protein
MGREGAVATKAEVLGYRKDLLDSSIVLFTVCKLYAIPLCL